MKKIHYFFPGLFVLLTLAACSQAKPQKPADQVIKEGITNLAKVTSYQYEGKVKADLQGDGENEPKKINFDFNFSGNLDFKNIEDPKMNLQTNVEAVADTQNATGAFEARVNKDALFINISKFTVKDDQGTTVPKEFSDKYIGKWSKIAIPAGFFKELSSELPLKDDANLTPQQKQLKQLFENANFLKDINYVGAENVKGMDSFHYHAILNQDGVYDFMLKLAEMQQKTLSDEEKKTLKEDLQKYDLAVDIWVGVDNALLDQAILTVGFKGSATEPKGTVTLSGTLYDFNKAVTVEVPKDAQDLPLDELALPGLVPMGDVTTPSVDMLPPPDSSDYSSATEMTVPKK